MPENPADASYAQTAPVTCPACGHGFEFDVWLIVDTARRPDLVERIRRGTLHDVDCPRCGATIGQADAPLLLYTPSPSQGEGRGGGPTMPPLLFAPARQTSVQQDQEQAVGLVGLLRERLGPAWQDDWLAQGLPNLPRAMLPAALSDDPGAALRELAESVQAELERLRQEDPEAFARLEEAARAALTEEAEAQAAEEEDQIATEEDLPEEMQALAGALESLPPAEREALMEIFAELAASGVELRSPADLEALLASRPDLRARLEAVAQAMDMGGGMDIPPRFRNDLQQAQEAEQRYLRTGDRSALDVAAAAWQRVLDDPAFVHSQERFQLAAMNNAGGVFLRRYWSAGRTADLNRALELWRSAVQRTPPDSPDLPSRLNNLGTGLRDRYARTGALADLEEAIRVYQTAVQRTPPDSPDLPSLLNNLGTGLSDRYARTGALADLEEAIRVYQTAVQRTPPDSPDLPSLLNNLGTGLRDRYARTGALADLEEARNRYAQACQIGQTVQPEAVVVSSRSWGNWALQRRAWDEVVKAYAFGRQATDTLFATQTSRAAKESWLQEAQGLPASAAYALARLDRPEEAVVALEAGRARLLAEALEANRRDLEQLDPLGHGDLLARYRAAAGRLAALQAQVAQPAAAPGAEAGSPRDFATLSQEIQAARGELDAAIAAIRQVPGYEDFFRPPSFEKIRQAISPSPCAGEGPGVGAAVPS